jgi:hypothetical protein
VGAPVVVVVLGAVVVVVDDGVVIVGTVTVVEVGNGIVVVVGSGRLVVVTGMLDVVTGMLDVVTGVLDVVTGRLDVVTGRLDVVTGRLVVVTGGTVTTGVTNVHVSAWSAGVSVTGVAGFDENPYPPKNTRWPSASSAMTGNVPSRSRPRRRRLRRPERHRGSLGRVRCCSCVAVRRTSPPATP